MDELIELRRRHFSLKIELLRLTQKIENSDPEDALFYQEICERYAKHIKNMQVECYDKFGLSICNCSFNPEVCE